MSPPSPQLSELSISDLCAPESLPPWPLAPTSQEDLGLAGCGLIPCSRGHILVPLLTWLVSQLSPHSNTIAPPSDGSSYGDLSTAEHRPVHAERARTLISFDPQPSLRSALGPARALGWKRWVCPPGWELKLPWGMTWALPQPAYHGHTPGLPRHHYLCLQGKGVWGRRVLRSRQPPLGWEV